MKLERLKSSKRNCRKINLVILLSALSLFALSFAEREEYESNCPVYTSGSDSEHSIALTFDDGPHPELTPVILDVLKEYDVNATFFVVGENVKANGDIVERIILDGHEIGNHTFGHKYLFKHKNTRRDMEREIDLCDDEIFNHSEYSSVLFRPPGGIYDATLTSVCGERGYSMVLWSIDTRDWEGKSASEIENEILNNVSDGSIILMHDYVCVESHTAEALRSVIPKLKELGYCFVTVSELIGN